MKLRVGLVGLGGQWELRHRPALRALAERYEVRAICEQVSHRAKQAAAEFQAACVDGFRALAMREDVDAVLMLSPQWYGVLPILAACDAGKAVYCAAPLNVDLDEARQLRDRVDASGIAFMAEFPRRLAPATLRLKELIATRLGAPRLLFCHNRFSTRGGSETGDDDLPHIRTTRILIELVDWCRFVVGAEPTSVNGVRHMGAENSETSVDYEMMSLDFSSPDAPGTAAVAQVSAGRYVTEDWPEAITFRPPAALQVACENGVAFIDLPSTLIWFDKAGRHLESLESERPVGEQLLVQFHRAVTSLVRKTCGLEDAYRSLAIVLAARKGHRDGRRVNLAPPPSPSPERCEGEDDPPKPEC
jgi:predicted dehydrogenase